MRIFKRFVVMIMCIASLLSLFGCKSKEEFILDGPGMISPSTWRSFRVSRSDSYAQYNFHITVTCYDGDGYVVEGTLRDDDGTGYEDDQGIILPESACRKIYALGPQDLPDLVYNATENAEDGSDEELILLDAPEVLIEVECADGRLLEKADENGFSIQVYEIVLPYFREKFK